MAKAIKSITVRWKWKGDKYAIKGFNLAVCPLGKTPLESQTAFVNTNAEHKTIDADGHKNYEYIFKDITLEVGATYNTWVQAIYEGKDSVWVNTSGGSVTDDGKDSIPSITPTSFRYIRSWLNGSSVNTGNHWMEIQAFNKTGENVALEKSVTGSVAISNASRITDGFIANENGLTNGQYASASPGDWVWVKVDLETVYTDITHISIWHYYEDNREYNSKLEVSKDGNTWIELFNSEIQGRYKETVKGKTYIIDAAYINDKLNVGETIEDINNSHGGQIEYAKLNIKGAISFDDLDETAGAIYDVERHPDGSVKQTFINGASIKTGSIEAEKVKMYNLNVVRRKKDENNIWQELDTSFSVSEEGHIKASGTFSSFNYRPDNGSDVSTSTGWMISEDGDSVFNNTIVRGRVELPSAGITDYGNNLSQNLLYNTIYDNGTHGHDMATGTSLDTTFKYKDIYNTIKYQRNDLTSSVWWSANPKKIPLLENEVISASVMVYLPSYYEDSVPNPLTGNSNQEAALEVQFFDESDNRISVEIIALKYNTKDEWVKLIIQNKQAPAGTKKANARVWCKQNGKFWITQLKLEKGTIATDWMPGPDDKTSLTRFWAGETYERRDIAPFRVLQDGSLYATKGTFQGTFTGNLEIGNISIRDTVGTPDLPSIGVIEIKDDTNTDTKIRIGEDYSVFNSNVFFGEKDNHFMMANSATNELTLERSGAIKLNYYGEDEYYQHYDPENPDPDMFFNSHIHLNGHRIAFDNSMSIRGSSENTLRIGSRKAYSQVELRSDFSGEEDGSGPGIIDLIVRGNIDATHGVTIGRANIKAVYGGSSGSGVDIFIQ